MLLVTLIPYLRDLFKCEGMSSRAPTWVSIVFSERSVRFRIRDSVVFGILPNMGMPPIYT